ncbi:glycoside hydrolase family 3 C-terminal domain-containing protein [Streptomyces boninensis]|uniref:glycoside hydrolase family 3 C-terminal domain-containing protein n=1 Tax=Streptomyces boninensis TaxID=2039455 RepID=UPI003B2185F0
MTAPEPPYRDPQLPLPERVADLLGRLTVDERIAMLHQFAPAVERLGLGAFRTGQEALHGVAWMGPATVFPQAVGLGATWNAGLVRRIGEAVGREVRAMRVRDERVGLNVWSPTVNLLRHPLWGRGEEGYSEDPWLTSAIATAYTRGLRGDHPVQLRTAPILKHWLAHNNETERDTSSSSVRARVLHEYDLPAFRGTIESGAAVGVMPAYNLVNGRPNHVSPYLSSELRAWAPHRELAVCSDAGAPSNLVDSEHYFGTHEEALAASLKAGVDSFTDHGQDSAVTVGRLRAAYDKGLIGDEDVDRAVRRLLTMRFALGEFGPDPYAEEAEFDSPRHRELAAEAAEQAVVLLKNDGLLPLAPGARIAVVGLLADECKLDWYSGALLRRATPLAALRERFGTDAVTYAEGCDRVRLRCEDGWVKVPFGAADARAGVGPAAEGAADGDAADAAALDPALLPGRTDLPPLTCDAARDDATELALVDWDRGTVTLRAPDGHYLSVAEDGYVRASADQPGGWVVQETFRLVRHGAGHLLRHLGTGRYVSVAADGLKVAAEDEAGVFHLEYAERGTDAVARAAAGADAVVVIAGNDPHIAGRETEDRTTLALPPQQDALWRAAHAVNPRTILALTSSYPYAVPGAHAALPALLWSAHGGQAAGTGLARVLAGDVSPGGRLPQTWYADDADLPDLLDYDIIGSRQTYLYFDGSPLYPFGHGLSYAAFRYEDLTVRRIAEAIEVTVAVTNTGDRDVDEVVQIYGAAIDPRVPRPHRALLAFERRRIGAGERAEFRFRRPLAELGHYDVGHGRWTVDPGPYEIQAGASSADVRLRVPLDVGGPEPRPRPVRGRSLRAADYDEQRGTVLVDRSRAAGDAVAPAGDRAGDVLFRDCDFGGDGVRGLEITAAATGPGAVSLRAGGAEVTVPVAATGGPYDYVRTAAALAVNGVHDLRMRIAGPVRIAELSFRDRPDDG